MSVQKCSNWLKGQSHSEIQQTNIQFVNEKSAICFLSQTKTIYTPVPASSRQKNLHPILEPAQEVLRYLSWGAMKLRVEYIKFLSAIFFASLIASSCTYKSPATNELLKEESEFSKDFFFKTSVDSKTGKTVLVPRKFMCGWASEMESGPTASQFYMNNAIVTNHCNVIFELAEKMAIAKLINPSFPDDPSRWEVAFKIPISSHHYIEKEKDNVGREKNVVIRNSSRSHWSARSHMTLNLSEINLDGVFPSWESYLGLARGNNSISKIEVDESNHFLGFSIEKTTSSSSYSTIRFNIKEIETNPNFVSTPYQVGNSEYLNALHVIGEKQNGVNQVLRAGHWDVSKKIEVRLWQVPEKYKDVIKEIVADWNEVFQKAEVATVAGGPFFVSDTPAEHAFDLRYPTIAWVSDEQISTRSPLGIGMALADVTNGEIKWGMITIYSGFLESYMKMNLSVGDSASAEAKQKMSQLSKTLMNFVKVPSSMKQIEPLRKALMGLAPAGLDPKIAATAREGAYSIQSEIDQKVGAGLGFVDLLSSSILTSKNKSSQRQESKMSALQISGDEGRTSILQAKEALSILEKKYSSSTFCLDRSGGDYASALQGAMNGLELDEHKLRKLIKELVSHEFGHFLGLGHQFKENILPSSDRVPKTIYDSIAAKASEEKKYTNYTSIMGYRHPKVELADDSEKKPGPHDLLVIRYLYKQQYATYKTGDDKFTFFDLPAGGLIPQASSIQPDYKTSYFPQCNDIQASYGLDPYCNRFDVGNTATSIISKYFDDLKDTLPQTIVAFTDSRGDHQWAEFNLWKKALTTLGRVRTFYDYMRVYFKKPLAAIMNSEESLIGFSQACQESNPENTRLESLKKLFSENPELIDLCRANSLALRKMKDLATIKGQDFTEVDLTRSTVSGSMTGGDAELSFDHALGRWKELTVFPLKYAALMAMTEPSPWVTFDDGGVYPNLLYSTPKTLFSYMYFYPREYTDAIASNLKSNLHFSGFNGADRTSLGRSIMSMMWMNQIGNNDNRDAGLFPESLKAKLRQQLNFDVRLLALIVKGEPRKEDPSRRIVKWSGDAFDFTADVKIPLGSVYMLPEGKVVATISDRLIYPITEFTQYKPNEGFLFAYSIQFDQNVQLDVISDLSSKKDLADHSNRLLSTCIRGSENGLSKFFNSENEDFPGFEMGNNVQDATQRKRFFESIEESFRIYESNKSPKTGKPLFSESSSAPTRTTCLETLRGLGLLVNTGAIMNGYFLPNIFDYLP